jgi:hypothetical protein
MAEKNVVATPHRPNSQQTIDLRWQAPDGLNTTRLCAEFQQRGKQSDNFVTTRRPRIMRGKCGKRTSAVMLSVGTETPTKFRQRFNGRRKEEEDARAEAVLSPRATLISGRMQRNLKGEYPSPFVSSKRQIFFLGIRVTTPLA